MQTVQRHKCAVLIMSRILKSWGKRAVSAQFAGMISPSVSWNNWRKKRKLCYATIIDHHRSLWQPGDWTSASLGTFCNGSVGLNLTPVPEAMAMADLKPSETSNSKHPTANTPSWASFPMSSRHSSTGLSRGGGVGSRLTLQVAGAVPNDSRRCRTMCILHPHCPSVEANCDMFRKKTTNNIKQIYETVKFALINQPLPLINHRPQNKCCNILFWVSPPLLINRVPFPLINQPHFPEWIFGCFT